MDASQLIRIMQMSLENYGQDEKVQLEKMISDSILDGIVAQNPVPIKATPIADLFEEAMAKRGNKGQITGIETGYPILDRMTQGLHRGEFSIIAGPPGRGKTMFANNIIHNTAVGNKAVKSLIFSFEQSSASMVNRTADMHQSITEENSWQMDIPLLPIYFFPKGIERTKRNMESVLQSAMEDEVQLVLIDHLSMLPDLNNEKRFSYSQWCNVIREWCQKYDMHILLIHHTNKLISDSAEPEEKDLAEAQGIANLADNIFLVWDSRKEGDRVKYVKITKNRNHENTGTIFFKRDDGFKLWEMNEIEKQKYLNLLTNGENQRKQATKIFNINK